MATLHFSSTTSSIPVSLLYRKLELAYCMSVKRMLLEELEIPFLAYDAVT